MSYPILRHWTTRRSLLQNHRILCSRSLYPTPFRHCRKRKYNNPPCSNRRKHSNYTSVNRHFDKEYRTSLYFFPPFCVLRFPFFPAWYYPRYIGSTGIPTPLVPYNPIPHLQSAVTTGSVPWNSTNRNRYKSGAMSPSKYAGNWCEIHCVSLSWSWPRLRHWPHEYRKLPWQKHLSTPLYSRCHSGWYHQWQNWT